MNKDDISPLELELKKLADQAPLLEEQDVDHLLEAEETKKDRASSTVFGVFNIILVLLAPLYMHIRKYLYKKSKRKGDS